MSCCEVPGKVVDSPSARYVPLKIRVSPGRLEHQIAIAHQIASQRERIQIGVQVEHRLHVFPVDLGRSASRAVGKSVVIGDRGIGGLLTDRAVGRRRRVARIDDRIRGRKLRFDFTDRHQVLIELLLRRCAERRVDAGQATVLIEDRVQHGAFDPILSALRLGFGVGRGIRIGIRRHVRPEDPIEHFGRALYRGARRAIGVVDTQRLRVARATSPPQSADQGGRGRVDRAPHDLVDRRAPCDVLALLRFSDEDDGSGVAVRPPDRPLPHIGREERGLVGERLIGLQWAVEVVLPVGVEPQTEERRDEPDGRPTRLSESGPRREHLLEERKADRDGPRAAKQRTSVESL